MTVTLGLLELGGMVMPDMSVFVGIEEAIALLKSFELRGVSIMIVPASVPVGGT